MKTKELILEHLPKSEERVRNVLEMQGLYFARAAKSAEANENKGVGIFVPAKGCAGC